MRLMGAKMVVLIFFAQQDADERHDDIRDDADEQTGNETLIFDAGDPRLDVGARELAVVRADVKRDDPGEQTEDFSDEAAHETEHGEDQEDDGDDDIEPRHA